MSLRAARLLVALPLAGLFAWRAVEGVPASVALARGNLAVSRGAYAAARVELRVAGTGFDRFEARWRLADAAIDVWEKQAVSGGPGGSDPALLDEAGVAHLEGICLAPASRRSWAGLSIIYHKLEWIGRSARALEGYRSSPEPWEQVGRPGRVAIGLARQAVGRAPNWYLHRDWLARGLWTYGLEEAARDAVREAAATLPIYSYHSYLRRPGIGPPARDVFVEASRAVLGQVPLIDPGTQLVDLGKLELDRGNPEAAAADFHAALALGLDPLREAEGRFYLGLALVGGGREEEGSEQLVLASAHPLFKQPALANLVLFAERADRHDLALFYLQELRRVEPENVEHCLRYAAAAMKVERWDAALEALRWAQLIQPDDPRPLAGQVRAHWAAGRSTAALQAWRDLQATAPDSAEAQEILEALGPAAR